MCKRLTQWINGQMDTMDSVIFERWTSRFEAVDVKFDLLMLDYKCITFTLSYLFGDFTYRIGCKIV